MLESQINSENTIPLEHSERVKQIMLFVDTLDFMLKTIDEKYSSDDVVKVVNMYLSKNKYNYEEAKKHLFEEIEIQVKKQREVTSQLH